MKIPRKLGHIWIGPKEAPQEWMQSWVDHHPSWEYSLYDNAYLLSRDWETRAQIDEYLKRGWYAGAADLMRYEILWRHGGYLAGADSVCIHPVDELFEDDGEIYTVFENEFLRGQMVAPIVAAVPGHPFLRLVIDKLKATDPLYLDHPWRETGNLFMTEMIEEFRPEIVIWPSWTLIPEHFLGRTYKGDGKIYARQMFGETNGLYRSSGWKARIEAGLRGLYASRARKRLRKAGRLKKI